MASSSPLTRWTEQIQRVWVPQSSMERIAMAMLKMVCFWRGIFLSPFGLDLTWGRSITIQLS